MRAPVLLIMVLLASSGLTLAHETHQGKQLPVIGPAPPFTLTSQDDKPMALADLRGKVVAVPMGSVPLP
jgi:protein SCO1